MNDAVDNLFCDERKVLVEEEREEDEEKIIDAKKKKKVLEMDEKKLFHEFNAYALQV